MSEFDRLFQKVAGGASLDVDEARSAIDALISGDVPAVRVAGFLIALKVRGETEAEIIGGIQALRARCRMITAPEGAIDVCGTGGDGAGTVNISTAVSIVVAACGVPVAKHGNRSVSSRSGSSDVLAALGLRTDLPFDALEASLRDFGIAFLMAPRHHPATGHVADIRKALGVRTLFNLIGPPTNPAGVKRQLMGVFDNRWLVPMAGALGTLGADRVWVVHGADGLDELALHGPSEVAEWTGTEVRRFQIDPDELDVTPAPISALAGGDPEENARLMLSMLKGARGAFHDIVCLNAGAALVVADRAGGLAEGIAQARAAILDGSALRLLERWRAFGQGYAWPMR
jgi:anthranilate phosphoribosyltransferase